MQGDFSRFHYRTEKRYSSVRQQQGRVWLDSDWNEQIAIQTHLERTEATDVIGCCGVPKYGGGFQVTLINGGQGPDLLIAPGRIYVHGVLGELLPGSTVPMSRVGASEAEVANLVVDGRPLATGEWIECFDGTTLLGVAQIAAINTGNRRLTLTWSGSLPVSPNLRLRRATTYLTQPDFPRPPALTPGTHYLVYLDVWQRHLTALEDPDIREVALGGPDTATRTRTMAQVKLLPWPTDQPPPTCAQLGRCWSPAGSASTARLRARAEPDPTAADPCIVPARAGYRRLENQLYRVEIHTGGDAKTATFKWSRDNGAVAYAVASVNAAQRRITLTQPARDRYLSLAPGDWVELVDDDYTSRNDAQPLLQVDRLAENGTLVELRASPAAVGQDPAKHPLLRRWDHGRTSGVSLVNGAIPVSAAEGAWFELEDGVQIFFEPGKTYQRGDYWTIPARTAINDAIGDVLWPRDGDEPRFELRHGADHAYCALAVLTAASTSWTISDCRRIFPPLTEIERGGCCIDVHPGDDIRQAIATALAAGGGRICLCAGLHTLTGPLDLRSARHLTIAGQGSATVLLLLPAANQPPTGITLRGCAYVEFADMTVVGSELSSLFAVYADDLSDQRSPAHNIALRRMTLVNIANRKNHPAACAVRLAGTDSVVIEACRLAAPLGIVSLSGEHLPRVSIDQSAERVRRMTFDDVQAGRDFKVGEQVASGGVTGTTRVFTWSNGQTTDQGLARVQPSQLAGGAGNELNLNNINLAFDAGDRPWREVSIQFGHAGGNLNLDINGELRNVGNPAALDQQTIGGVAVNVVFSSPESQRQGTIRLSGVINTFAIGGQEFWIDNLVLSEESPFTVDYGAGVMRLDLLHSQIRYEEAGIVALRAEDWLIADCEVQSVDLPNTMPLPSGEDYRQWFDRLDTTIFAAHATVQRGIGLFALIWQRCVLRDSRIASANGCFAWLWLAGVAENITLTVDQTGLAAAWLHRAHWRNNRIDCVPATQVGDAQATASLQRDRRSQALILGGSYRARIIDNILRCDDGLANLTAGDLLSQLGRTVTLIERLYASEQDELAGSQRILWLMLEELTRLAGLQSLRDRVQDLLSALAPAAAPVLWLAAEWLAAFLSRQKDPAAITFALPQMALLIRGNDIAAIQRCIALDRFVPLGGMQIVQNRLHTVTGQALALHALPQLANVQLNIFGWRTVMQSLHQQMNRLADSIGDRLPAQVRRAAIELLRTLAAQIERWSQQSEAWLEADYRIEGNSIRSQKTAVASNLFELAIVNNHITMQEQALKGSEQTDLLRALASSATLAPLSFALKRGEIADLPSSGERLAATLPSVRTAAVRRDLGEAAGRLSASSDPAIRASAVAVGAAVAARDIAAVRDELPRLAAAIAEAFDTYGIALSGVGCRVIGNHILVPPDADPETWARGGVRIGVDPQQWLLALLLGTLDEQRAQTDVIGLTETLIEGNEIIGGAGHGIEVRGKGDVPSALFDLKVYANQVRGMAGAGVLIEEQALAIGVDIADNHIINCSDVATLAELTDATGGIVGRNLAFCHVHGNRITGCGAGQTIDDAWGIDLDTVYQATLADNAVQNNGADNPERQLLNGGIRIRRVSGEIGVKQCDVVRNRGLALLIENVDYPANAATALDALRQTLLNAYFKQPLQTPPAGMPTTSANVQGNRLETAPRTDPFAASLSGRIQSIATVLFNHNSLAHGNFRILGEQRGVISGNVADSASIIAQNPVPPANLVDGLNLPPILRI